jgi:AcrR family transcriptional regulator
MNVRSPRELTSPPARLRAKIRETTVNAILTAAEEVFADAGLHAAHMGEIASRSGVAVGTLYNHFADREALLTGLIQARSSELLVHMDAALRTGAGRPFRERLRLFVVAMSSFVDRHRSYMRIVLQGEIGRYQQTFPLACGKLQGLMHEKYARAERLIKQGVRDKAIRPELADLAAHFLLGMVRTLIIRDVVLGIGDGMSVEVDRLTDAFLHGMGGSARGAST